MQFTTLFTINECSHLTTHSSQNSRNEGYFRVIGIISQHIRSIGALCIYYMIDEEIASVHNVLAEDSLQSNVELEASSDNDTSIQQLTWWNQLKTEVQMPDTFILEDLNGCYINALQTFAPLPILRTRVIRVVLLLYNTACWIWDMKIDRAREHYFIFLTRWAMVLSHVYLVLSISCAFYPNLILSKYGAQNNEHTCTSNTNQNHIEITESDNSDKDETQIEYATPNDNMGHDEQVSLLAKIQWELGATINPVNIIVVLVYWTTKGNPSTTAINYLQIWIHGLLCCTILFDTLIISCIPIRIRHFRSVALFASVYMFWTILHAVFGIGNNYHTNWSGGDDDDVIYTVVNWKKRVWETLGFTYVLIFVLLPVLFLLLRQCSLHYRRYYK